MTEGPAEVVLRIPSVVWHSQGDEDACFNWLYSISGYATCRGQGWVLYVHFNMAKIEQSSLVELVAWFRRYIAEEIKQLRVFESSPVGKWFSSPEMYWHEEVFSEVTALQ